MKDGPREHLLMKVPALPVVGKTEAETGSVSVRRLGSEDQKVIPRAERWERLSMKEAIFRSRRPA